MDHVRQNESIDSINQKERKAFTLIELIVVMAVIGVLVLLAAPKFINYTQKAQLSNIKNDTKVMENLVDEHLVLKGSLTGWETYDQEDLEALMVEGMLYTAAGPAKEVKSGNYSLVPDSMDRVSRLKGDFYANELGDTYYVSHKAMDIREPGNLILNPQFKTNSLRAWRGEDVFVAEEDNSKVATLTAGANLYQVVDVPVEGEYTLSYKTYAEAPVAVSVSHDAGGEAIAMGEDSMVAAAVSGSYSHAAVAGWSTHTETLSLTEGKTKLEWSLASGEVKLTKLSLKGVGAGVDEEPVIPDVPGEPEQPEEPVVVIPSVAAEGYFTFDASTKTITAYHPKGVDGTLPEILDVNIPQAIGGVTVASIGNSAFKDKGLTSVYLPDTVTKIGVYSFVNNSLKVIRIGSNVAHNMDELTSFGLTFALRYRDYDYVGGTYRYGTPTNTWRKDDCDPNYIISKTSGTLTHYLGIDTNLVIPDKIIRDGVAYDVKAIGNMVFKNKGLTSVVIPQNITKIGYAAFDDNQLISIVIPESVKSIGHSAFTGNPLKTVSIGSNVDLGYSSSPVLPYSFFERYNLYEKTAGTYRHDKTWKKDDCDPSYTLNRVSGAITSYVGTGTTISIPASVIMDGVPYAVKTISSSVFMNKGLTSVTIPDSVTSIGSSAFKDNALTQLTLGNSVKTIQGNAFSGNQLTAIQLPASVTDVYGSAFDSNPLKAVTIGSNVNLGSAASPGIPSGFYSRYALYENTSGTYRRDDVTKPWIKDNCDPNYTMNRSTGKITAYLGTETNLVIPDTVMMDGIQYPVKSIGENAFKQKGLTSVVIPDGVTSIMAYAFFNNELTNVVLGRSVVSLSSYAFSTNKLTSVQIPASVTSIGTDVFRHNGPAKNSGTFTTIGARTWTLTGTETIWK